MKMVSNVKVLQSKTRKQSASNQTFSKENRDEENPWPGILAATMFAIRGTYHTTMQASPMQLVFGRVSSLKYQI
jgi:hypothetical protein